MRAAERPGWRDDSTLLAVADGTQDHRGQLRTVERIADPGLGEQGQGWAGSRRMPAFANSSGETADVPPPDPVPQELTAMIEARFTGAGVSLIGDTLAPSAGDDQRMKSSMKSRARPDAV